MMDNHKVIATYTAVSELTGQMLLAAQSSDWERLSTLETECAVHVNVLKSGEAGTPLTASEREHKLRMIQKILADDKAIREITEPWIDHLANLLNSNGAKRKLSNTYGAAPPG